LSEILEIDLVMSLEMFMNEARYQSKCTIPVSVITCKCT
jgi:hypothetical protein